MKLTFLGAAGEVTGSSCLVETDRLRFLVDCGMFQGGRDTGRKNRARFASAWAGARRRYRRQENCKRG